MCECVCEVRTTVALWGQYGCVQQVGRRRGGGGGGGGGRREGGGREGRGVCEVGTTAALSGPAVTWDDTYCRHRPDHCGAHYHPSSSVVCCRVSRVHCTMGVGGWGGGGGVGGVGGFHAC